MSDRTRILIVDDEEGHAEALSEGLSSEDYSVFIATSGHEGLQRIQESNPDLVITDLKMHDVDGIEILRRAKERVPDAEVIVVTGFGTVETAVEAMHEGAANYLRKPINLGELRTFVRKAIERQHLHRRNVQLERRLDEKFGVAGIVGNSAQMMKVLKTLQQIAPTSATVLITGESGTGKELIAQAIHNNSPRRKGPFVALNCAALPEGLLESELFGHERGAFTGAVAQRKGKFEFAHNGTLFLDEVGDIPLSTQVTLLRVIETREFVRVGSNASIKVDVRVVAATNQDIDKLVEEGRFRQDLYFRLKVVEMKLPPLRERPEDIPLLVEAFVQEFAETHNRPINSISRDVLNLMLCRAWPGNVRELKNIVESMVIISTDDVLDMDDVPETFLESGELASAVVPSSGMTIREMEKELIKRTLSAVEGNRVEAAKILGIGERTLYRKLKEYELR